MLNNILPVSEAAEKLETVLRPALDNLYFVGNNARNFIYGFPMADKTFEFIVSQDKDLSELKGRARILPGYVSQPETPNEMGANLPFGIVQIKAIPVDRYLLSSVFAGDAVVIHVQSGRMICIPEYLTVKPTTRIREEKQFGLPENALFKDEQGLTNRRKVLGDFEKATEALANSLNATPAQS